MSRKEPVITRNAGRLRVLVPSLWMTRGAEIGRCTHDIQERIRMMKDLHDKRETKLTNQEMGLMKGDGVDGTKDRTRVKWLSWWKRQQGKPKQKAEGLSTKSLTGLESGEKFVVESKSRILS